MQLVVKLSKNIVETYKVCNPTFPYSITPKRYLTKPSEGVNNSGRDNKEWDLIVYVGSVLAYENRRYVVEDELGKGSFGQVFKCRVDDSDDYVAVKVIKNLPHYFQQATTEFSICSMLNRFDPKDEHNIVRILGCFVFHDHLCLIFELLNANLYKLLECNYFKGLSMELVRLFTKQILGALALLRDTSVVHCDLKPANICLKERYCPVKLFCSLDNIKVLDFGSASRESYSVSNYMQSRYYRAPEVVLRHLYTTAIDIWSLGCVAAELFLGVPLFRGESEYDLLQRMNEILGSQPPDHVLQRAKYTKKYFKVISAAPLSSHFAREGHTTYQFLSEAEFEAREQRRPKLGGRLSKHKRLDDIILFSPLRTKMTEAEISAELQARVSFLDFLKGVLHFDPLRRWKPRQALQHPFLTEEPLSGPWRPPPDTSHNPVFRAMAMDHNPITGHWSGGGLSPRVNCPLSGYYNSESTGLSYATSPGGMSGYVNYGNGTGVGGRLGSFGDSPGVDVGCPTTSATGATGQHNQVGASVTNVGATDKYHRMHVPHVPMTNEMSPSNVMGLLSLGTSPSHSIPPSPGSYSHASPGSKFYGSPISFTGSPNSTYYGSPIVLASPSSSHGSPGWYGTVSPAQLGKYVHYNNHSSKNKGRPVDKMSVPSPKSNNHIAAARQGVPQENGNGNDSAMRDNGPELLRPSILSNSYPRGSLGAFLMSGEDVVCPPEVSEVMDESA